MTDDNQGPRNSCLTDGHSEQACLTSPKPPASTYANYILPISLFVLLLTLLPTRRQSTIRQHAGRVRQTPGSVGRIPAPPATFL